jgi:hypothetical protein
MGRAFEFRKGRKMKRWSAMAKAFTRIGKDSNVRKVDQILMLIRLRAVIRIQRQLICLKKM